LAEIDAIFAKMEAGEDVTVDGVEIKGAKGKEYRGRTAEDHKK
jgi:hypothetical protein